MPSHADTRTAFDDPARDVAEVPRTETALRLVYSAVFAIALHLVAGILSLLVLFQLAFALATRRKPHPRLEAFGDALGRYTRQVMGYLTYNTDAPPFPFDDLPAAPRE